MTREVGGLFRHGAAEDDLFDLRSVAIHEHRPPQPIRPVDRRRHGDRLVLPRGREWDVVQRRLFRELGGRGGRRDGGVGVVVACVGERSARPEDEREAEKSQGSFHHAYPTAAPPPGPE